MLSLLYASSLIVAATGYAAMCATQLFNQQASYQLALSYCRTHIHH